MQTVLRLLRGSLPCLLLAAIPVWRISLLAPLPRRDRLMLLLLMYAAYAAAFVCLHMMLKVLRSAAVRLRGRRGEPRPTREGSFVWEYYLVTGLLVTNALHFYFGYKKIGVPEQTWLMARGLIEQLLLLIAAWAVLFLLFSLIDRRWPAALGSALEQPATIALILAVSLSCVAPPGPGRRAAPAGAAFAADQISDPAVVPPPHRPLILIGLDGADWRLLKAAIRTGRLETLDMLVREGLTSSLDNGGLGLSPVVWTTIATGKRMEEHGIFGFDVTRSPLFEKPLDAWLRYSPPEFAVWPAVKALRQMGLVKSRLATGMDRQGPSMWQILSHHNYRNLVVNYMTSFPAEKINGIFLAESTYTLTLMESGEMEEDSRFEGKTAEGKEYPVGLLAREYSHIRPSGKGPQDPTSRHEREFDFLAPLTLEMLNRNTFDFMTFYTWVTDSFNHGLTVAEYEAMVEGHFDQPLARRFLDVYEKIDDFVAELRRLRPDANLVLLSDHGVAPGYEQRRRRLLHGPRPFGIFIAHGPDIRLGTHRAPISMLDIAPTVLYYFDVPVPRDFEGTIAKDLFTSSHAPRYVDSYDPIVRNARVETHRGEISGARERLKALGYIE